MATATLLTQEMFLAMQQYKSANGRDWKRKLTDDWLSDHRDQWGTLREVRNHVGIQEAFKAFDEIERLEQSTQASEKQKLVIIDQPWKSFPAK